MSLSKSYALYVEARSKRRDLSPDEKELLAKYRAADDREKRAIQNVALRELNRTLKEAGKI